MHEGWRGALWHAGAGLAVGAAGTVRLAPLATEVSRTLWPSDDWLSTFVAVAVCTPLVAAMTVVVGAPRSAPTWMAVLGPAALAPIAGTVGVVASYALKLALEGRPVDAGEVLSVGMIWVPFGVFCGMLFSVPLGLAAWAARRRVARFGAGAGVVGLTAALLVVAMLVGGESRTFAEWYTGRAACAACALACLLCAARGLPRSARLPRAALAGAALVLTLLATSATLATAGLPKVCAKSEGATVEPLTWGSCPRGLDWR